MRHLWRTAALPALLLVAVVLHACYHYYYRGNLAGDLPVGKESSDGDDACTCSNQRQKKWGWVGCGSILRPKTALLKNRRGGVLMDTHTLSIVVSL